MKHLILTQHSLGLPLLIPLRNFAAAQRIGDGGAAFTRVYTTAEQVSGCGYFDVRQTPREIAMMLANAERASEGTEALR